MYPYCDEDFCREHCGKTMACPNCQNSHVEGEEEKEEE